MRGAAVPALRPDEAGPRRGPEGREGVTTREFWDYRRGARDAAAALTEALVRGGPDWARAYIEGRFAAMELSHRPHEAGTAYDAGAYDVLEAAGPVLGGRP